VPLVALLLALLAASPPVRRADLPLVSILLEHLPAGERSTPIMVVDLEEWSVDDSAKRGAARQRIARLLDVLGQHDALFVGLDVLLGDTTTPEADEVLATALRENPRAVVAAELQGDRSRAVPLARPFSEVTRIGQIDLAPEVDGLLREYGLAGHLPESLAAVLAARVQPGLRLSEQPLLLRPLRADTPEEIWPPVSADALLSAPAGALRSWPSPAVVLIGVAGARGLELDPHDVLSAAGRQQVPGVYVHAMALDELLGGNAIFLAGFGGNAAALVVFLLLYLLVARLLGGGAEHGRRRALLLAAAAAATSPVIVFTWTAVLGSAISATAMLVAAPVWLAASWSFSLLARNARFAATVTPLLGHAPRPLRESFRAAFLPASPRERVEAALDAYEDLVYYLTLVLLVTTVLRRKRAGDAREEWHKPHTVSTLLATMRALDPDAHRQITERSSLPDQVAALLRSESSSKGGRGDEEKDAQEAKGGDLRVVDVRNTVAHDTTSAWLHGQTAVALLEALQEGLLSLLATPLAETSLRSYRLRCTTQEDPGTSTASALLEAVGSDGAAHSAHPWLLHRAPEPGGEPILLRYRGLLRSGRRRSSQPSDLRAVYTSYGVRRGGSREETYVSWSELAADVPPALQPRQAR